MPLLSPHARRFVIGAPIIGVIAAYFLSGQHSASYAAVFRPPRDASLTSRVNAYRAEIESHLSPTHYTVPEVPAQFESDKHAAVIALMHDLIAKGKDVIPVDVSASRAPPDGDVNAILIEAARSLGFRSNERIHRESVRAAIDARGECYLHVYTPRKTGAMMNQEIRWLFEAPKAHVVWDAPVSVLFKTRYVDSIGRAQPVRLALSEEEIVALAIEAATAEYPNASGEQIDSFIGMYKSVTKPLSVV